MSIGRLIRVAPIALSASGCGLPLDLGWREAGVVDVPDAAVVARDTGAVVDAGRADAPSPDAPSPDSRPEDVGDGGAGMDADARDVAVDAPRPDLVAPLDCGPGAYQDGAACSCVLGHTLCGGGCFDLQTDPEHCNGCGMTCNGGSCVRGTCQCPNGQTRCSAVCVDTSSTQNHCGGCYISCGAGSCVEGRCRCRAPEANCGTGCVNPQTSDQHCGACANRCRPGNRCQNGMCVCADGGVETAEGGCCGASRQPCCLNPETGLVTCLIGLVCRFSTCRSPS